MGGVRWLAAGLLLCAGFCAAAVVEPDGYWQGESDAPTPTTLRGSTVIHAAELEALIHQGGSAVVDVSNAPRRPSALAPGAPWLPVAHSVVPGAQWIPGAGAGLLTEPLDDLFRATLARMTNGNFAAPLVVYCHERCWLSWNAAKRAMSYGYRRVYWFPDGIEGWKARGLATVAANPQTTSALAQPAAEKPAPSRPTIAVLDLELTGDLGGPDFTAEHDARLKLESMRLRQALERTQIYSLVNLDDARAAIDTLKSQQRFLHDCNGCDLDIGRQLNAALVMVAWVDRVSGLILSLTYEIHDVASGQIVARKSYDFRGDNDTAWNHAIDYMVRDIKASAAGLSSPSHLATNVEATALPTTLVALRPMSSR